MQNQLGVQKFDSVLLAPLELDSKHYLYVGHCVIEGETVCFTIYSEEYYSR